MSIKFRNHLYSKNLSRPDWKSSSDRKENMIFLDKNENNDKILQKIYKKTFNHLIENSISRYPDNSFLYNKLAFHLELDASNLLLGAGSDGIIRSVFESIINPGDKVILTSPTFAMYPIYSKIYQCDVIEIKYSRKKNVPYMDKNLLLELIRSSNAKLLCLPNPDSPTGTVFAPNDIKEILIESASVNTLVLIDEAYYPFYDISSIGLINEFENLIVTRTFAKAWGLAGLRVGYGISNNDLMKYLHKIKSMYEINTLGSNILFNAIDNYDEVMKSVNRLNQGKKWFMSEMKSMNFETWESHGNFSHVNFAKNTEIIHNALSDLVLYRKSFEEECLMGYSRFSSTIKEEFKLIVDKIKSAI